MPTATSSTCGARPAGRPLIDNPQERQAAGTVPADTGIVPLAAVAGGPPLPLWRADAVRQRYLPGTDVLRTEASFGEAPVAIECAAGAASWAASAGARPRVSFRRNLLGGGRRVHLDDERARRIVAGEVVAGEALAGAGPAARPGRAGLGEAHVRSGRCWPCGR